MEDSTTSLSFEDSVKIIYSTVVFPLEVSILM